MKKIFLLEDTDCVADLIQQICIHFKIEADITRATTVQEGVDILSRDQNFVLAILDYELPDGYGTELMETIRRNIPQCKIMVVSGCIPNDADAVRIIKRQNPDSMIRKPFNASEFITTVKELGGF